MEEGSRKQNDKKKIQNRRKTSKYINNHINLNRCNSCSKKKKDDQTAARKGVLENALQFVGHKEKQKPVI